MEVAGFTLTGDDLMLKRGFKGDTDVFEPAVSEDGKVMVALDTRKDEKVRGQFRVVFRRFCSYIALQRCVHV